MVGREGESGIGLYIIVSGQVEVFQQTKDRGTLTIASLGVGDFFGEQGLLDEAPRTASAQVVEPCIAIGFFRPDLLDLVERNPRLGLKIVMQLSQMISVRLRHTNGLLKEARERMQKAENDPTISGIAERTVQRKESPTKDPQLKHSAEKS
jgi:CRP-like cAMP-binding protein